MSTRPASAGSDACRASGTGRVWGTSASRAPRVTTSCTPSASARSISWALKACQRMDGSTPCTSTRSRGALGAGASKTSTPGQVISRCPLRVKRMHGRLAWKSKNSSGSTRAKRRACREEARNATALEAASPASFHPRKAHTIAGALRPAGRLSQIRGCIRTTVHHEPMSAGASTSSEQLPTIATLRSEQELDGVYACTRKERRISRAGMPFLAVELTDRTGTIAARAFRDADLMAGRFERGELVRVRGRARRFRDELQVELDAIARAGGGGGDLSRLLPAAYRDLDELEGFLEHLAQEVYKPRLKQLLEALLAEPRLRAELRRAPCSVPTAQGAANLAAGGGRIGSH